MKLHERIQYGGYASNTALDGFSKSNAAVMIVHSFDDEVVPAEYGYEIYYEKYKDDSRFSFIPLENKGHNYFNDDTYRNEFNANLMNGSKRLTMTITQRKTGNGFRRIKLIIYIKTLTGKNGVIHWIWSCSRIF